MSAQTVAAEVQEHSGPRLVESAAAKVDEASLSLMIEMGFDPELSRKALAQTGDLETASELVLVMAENKDGRITAPTKASVAELGYKMVIVVRGDLKMRPGKVAAQVGHGVLAAYKLALKNTPAAVTEWEYIGQMKVVVRCETQKELMDVYHQAVKMGVAAEYIQDAGRTQVEPGSITVCAVGPARADIVDQITGHLKLYN